MKIIYILLTVLIYTFFGTVVDVFISTNAAGNNLRITTKVFFHVFVAPIMFLMVILFVALTENKALNIFFGCGLLVGMVIRLFTSERKYLASFQVDEGHLIVEYLTPFFRRKTRRIGIAEITNLEATKANWLIDYPAAVTIVREEEILEFQILDKTLKAQVRNEINAANSEFGKMPASE